jgi:hypothetical protein
MNSLNFANVRRDLTRHHNIYYLIKNGEVYVPPRVSAEDEAYADRISELLIGELEQSLGYVFRQKRKVAFNSEQPDDSFESDNGIEQPSTSLVTPFFTRFYRCSQDESSANYAKYMSTVPVRKQRRRTVQQRYGCAGTIRITIAGIHGTQLRIRSIGEVDLKRHEILIHFRHKCHHPPRERKPVPLVVRNFIKAKASECESSFKMYEKVCCLLACLLT